MPSCKSESQEVVKDSTACVSECQFLDYEYRLLLYFPRLRYAVPQREFVDPWCSGLTCGPVKAEIAGSNPVGSANT